MAPRLSKRQQREQDELEALAGPSKLPHGLGEEAYSEEEEKVVRGSKQGSRAISGFAAVSVFSSVIHVDS